MAKYDLALFHAPSVFDFRRRAMFKCLTSEVVPSFQVFDMYPYGFLTLSTWLSRRGRRVGIFNLASKMILDPDYDPLKTIRSVNSLVYGVDLHWLVHAHGALEVARLIKSEHPDSLVLLGGVSATYFWREILEAHPYVDAVALGDTTEEAVEQIVERVDRGRGLEGIPGVAWRDADGRIRLEPPRDPPQTLDPYEVDHRILVKMTLRERDLALVAPCASFISTPIAAVLTVKGCPYNCVTCGGSRSAQERIFGRRGVALKSPEAIVREAESISSISKMTIFFIGDLRLGRGEEGALEVVERLKRADLDNPLMFEFFYPASRRLLEALRSLGYDVYIQISPESQDESVRRAFGRIYGNEELERMVRASGELGFRRLDLYFMTGLPRQTPEIAAGVADYVDRLINLHGGGRMDAFTAPLAPFVDPGSPAFEHPEAYGYEILFRDLESHRRALEEPHWSLTLNYRTKWMDRPDIVEASLNASLNLARVKRNRGMIGEDLYEIIEERVALDREIFSRLQRGPLTPEEESEFLERARELTINKEVAINKELYPTVPLSECLRLSPPLNFIVARVIGQTKAV